jgi:hypothetical protein
MLGGGVVVKAVTSLERYRRLPTEASMRDAITEAVGLRSGRVWFIRDSRDAPETKDLPDLIVIIPHAFAALVELKSHRRQLTAGQEQVAGMITTIERFWGGVVRVEPRDGETSYDDFLAMIEKT